MIISANKIQGQVNIGVFAPSHPAHLWFPEKYEHAKNNLIKQGFKIVEGSLVKSKKSQGYRTATAKERAEEFMELVENPQVNILIPVIGGYNTASILPFLDYDKIRISQKIVCGYSDITALLLAILNKSQIPTVYGPTIVPSFGEYAGIPQYTLDSFANVIFGRKNFDLFPPDVWSNHFLNAFTDEWKLEKRQYHQNGGWEALKKGHSQAKVIVANINTLVSLLATEYIPSFNDIILVLEEMDASLNIEERNLNALKLAGVFDNLKGLIFSKPEKFDDLKSGLKYENIISEIVGDVCYPIIYNFDCGHTIPMISIPQLSTISIEADTDYVRVTILENSIS